MPDMFSYFTSKGRTVSQSLSQPEKRPSDHFVAENEEHVNTCPSKKLAVSDGRDDLFCGQSVTAGDLFIVNPSNVLQAYPAIVVETISNENNRDQQQSATLNSIRIPLRRVGSAITVFIDPHSIECLRVDRKEQLAEYFHRCTTEDLRMEFEECMHLVPLEHAERIEMILGDEEPITKGVTGSAKRASFLDDEQSQTHIEHKYDATTLSPGMSNDTNNKTENVLLSKYAFAETSGADDDNNEHRVRGALATTPANDSQEYQHHSLEFLQDKFRKDVNGVPHYHPEADLTTLFVPSGFFNSKEVTPVMRQWWRLKSENFDTVLFFKMGKFYETYHMDADIAVRELGLVYMRGSVAHAGFPEPSFAQYASTLVQRGYKVARVEQTETPQMMGDRIKSSGSRGSEKVVKRELCSVTTPGTRLFDQFDVEVDVNNAGIGFGLLLVVVDHAPLNQLGVCVLDCSIGQLHHGQFTDDHTMSQLRTMLSSMPLPVAEVIVPKKVTSPYVQAFVSRSLTHAKREYSNEQLELSQVLLQLCSYFPEQPTQHLFEALELGEEDAANYRLALLAIGYCVNYLKKNKIDKRVVSMSNFCKYVPNSVRAGSTTQKYMVLDHNSITNLEILCNQDEVFNRSGSLLGLLDHCCTPFGHRLLPGVISQPLYKTEDIEERLDAVETLMHWSGSEEVRTKLRTLPDLERLLFRVHAQGNLLASDENHPDNRAVFFKAAQLNKKKVADLVNTLAGFGKLCEVVEELKPLRKSAVLRKLIYDECFTKTLETVEFFQKAFSSAEAITTGLIIPQPGVIPEYDDTVRDIEELKQWFETRLETLKDTLRINSLKYWSSGKSRYYIEVPQSLSAKLPSSFVYKSQRKGFCRYSLEELEQQAETLTSLEDTRDKLLVNSLGLLMKQLASNKPHLLASVNKVAMADCLFSLAMFSNGLNSGPTCRPCIVKLRNSGIPQPFIRMEQGYHPYLASSCQPETEVVSNDFVLGNDDDSSPNTGQRTMLITGPNMGGKSTLMRQVAIAVVLAQLGCYVPALSFTLTPVDRIFARLGASFDRPINGQSTFYVELLETATLLKHASPNSLVILDELGRGTATYDGMAIASAVLQYLATHIQCLVLFSTHYHSLVRDVADSPLGANFKYYQMCFMLDSQLSDTDSHSQRIPSIVFLYHLVKGICSNSYGFQVAQLTGLPQDLIETAKIKANELEKRFFCKRLLSTFAKQHTSEKNSQNDSLVSDLFRKIVSLSPSCS